MRRLDLCVCVSVGYFKLTVRRLEPVGHPSALPRGNFNGVSSIFAPVIPYHQLLNQWSQKERKSSLTGSSAL